MTRREKTQIVIDRLVADRMNPMSVETGLLLDEIRALRAVKAAAVAYQRCPPGTSEHYMLLLGDALDAYKAFADEEA